MLFASLLDRLTDSFLRWLGSLLRSRYLPPRAPGAFTFTTAQVNTPMGIAFEVTCHFAPPAVPADTAKREVTTTVNGTPLPAVESRPEVSAVVVGQFAVGDALSVSLVDIDASGNASEPTVETLTVVDAVAPPKPDEFGLSVAQVVTPDAPPPDAPPAA